MKCHLIGDSVVVRVRIALIAHLVVVGISLEVINIFCYHYCTFFEGIGMEQQPFKNGSNCLNTNIYS